MKKINYKELRETWIENVQKEGKTWLAHIEKRKEEIVLLQNEEKPDAFEKPELLFNIFAFLNWLAHVDLRNENYIEDEKLFNWLKQKTSWPLDIVRSFWLCLRNPIMHTGRENPFFNFERKSLDKKYKTYVYLHPNLNSDPSEFKDGFMDQINPFNKNEKNFSFLYPGLIRKLNIVLSSVLDGIKNADQNSLNGLPKINGKNLPFRFCVSNKIFHSDKIRS